MTKTPSDLKDKTEAADGNAAAEEVVLRDESDEIIDNLKNQLESLQSKLAEYRSAEGKSAAGGGGAATEGGASPELVAAWNANLTPHLASRLRAPAEELTSRLERLIEQAGDPELRAELERCRELAFFFYETFQKISDNHRLLTESLTAPATEVETAEFCRVLEYSLPGAATPIPVEKLPNVPRRITFHSRSAASVVKALADLAATLFGRELRIQVATEPPEAAGPEARHMLKFRIFSEGSGEEAGEGEEISLFAMRRGITAGTVVDLLYVEKIVELQEGRFAFYRREGKVFGFEVLLPYLPNEQ